MGRQIKQLLLNSNIFLGSKCFLGPEDFQHKCNVSSVWSDGCWCLWGGTCCWHRLQNRQQVPQSQRW